MAEGLPEDGHLVACELEPYLKEFAQPIFDKSPHGKKITVKTGSAMDTLKVREKKPSADKGLSENSPLDDFYFNTYNHGYYVLCQVRNQRKAKVKTQLFFWEGGVNK